LGLLDFTCKPAFFPHRTVPSRFASSALPHKYICQMQMTHIYPPAGAPESSAGRPRKYIRQTQMTHIYPPAGAPEFLSQVAPQVHTPDADDRHIPAFVHADSFVKFCKLKQRTCARRPQQLPSSQPVAKSVCMLVPVYPDHFAALAARMEMIRRTNTGPVVKSVVVFGDAAEHTDFCNRHPAACSEGTGFHAMNLDQLLGKEAHKAFKSSLGMEQPYSDFAYKGERFGCWAKSSGRVYQTVKKFYGAAFGPEACSTYWVCDAETLPFRKHNLSEHLELNARFPQLVISGWHDEPKCAKVQVDDGTDQSCAVLMSNVTNGMRYPSDTKTSIFTPQRWKQVFLFVDQWWFYERTVTADWLRFLEGATNMPAWAVFAYYMFSDMSVYGMMMHWSAYYAHPGRSKILNIREEIRKVDSDAFEACCACPEGVSDSPPACSTVADLLNVGGCLARIAMAKRLSIAVEGLGIFGIGNYNRFMYVAKEAWALKTQQGHGLHWCYINCFKPDAMQRLLEMPDADIAGINMFEAVFHNTKV
ncbi:unnamed protein product, partial [Polarella glacialis]